MTTASGNEMSHMDLAFGMEHTTASVRPPLVSEASGGGLSERYGPKRPSWSEM
eukprot:CAMPEP_0205898174 /NCGR_PEP_ID=MMETSP1083-20121108/25901_1 /ASSEMBLY_ACC=CAM_ASM_000430 /TAXON_ID=97485 /ORGANISM="Prymnesium parvum, Strain Texoma1" /LENGTH=52 /DNA_ID=CAMNT_0053263405 /DNA_START=329 /DNA_END=484 /DNA_ORIENTATION=+